MRRVNFWAVLVAGVVFWVVGALWYGVLYGEKWAAALGKTRQAQDANPAIPMVVALLLEMIIAAAIGWVTSRTGELNVARGIRVALGMWLGFVLTAFCIEYAFEGAPASLYWINLGHFLVGMLISGLIVGAWTSKAGNARAAGA